MENRIKEQQLYMFADRTSTAKIRSNQIRLYFSSLAYVELEQIASTIEEKLKKVFDSIG